MCAAACDAHKLGLARECEALLSSRFPKSGRVVVLQGMILEASAAADDGDYEQAEAFYQRILKSAKDEKSTLGAAAIAAVRKRLVCIARAKDDTARAVKLLNELLLDANSDKSAWCELASCYLELGMYRYVSLCCMLRRYPHMHTERYEVYVCRTRESHIALY